MLIKQIASKLGSLRSPVTRSILKAKHLTNLPRQQSFFTSVKSQDEDKKKSFFSIQDQTTMAPSDQEVSAETKNFYEKLSNKTLEDLTERFDEIGEELDEEISHYYDVAYSSGVLTIKFGPSIGTYVLNKQVPNLQIWLSSPFSGPKRYDLAADQWVYKHTGETLHQLLTAEISKCLERECKFENSKV